MAQATLLSRPDDAVNLDLFYIENGVLQRIPVGTAGQYLKVNSGATGYQFADITIPTAQASVGRSFKSGLYYAGDITGNDANVTLSNNAFAAVPFSVGKAATFDQIGIQCMTAAAGVTGRMGIYTDGTGQPGTLIAEGTTVADFSTTGAKTSAFSSNQTLAIGRYWIGVQSVGGNAIVNGRYTPNGQIGGDSLAAQYESHMQFAAAGALPATAPASSLIKNTPAPKVMLRAV